MATALRVDGVRRLRDVERARVDAHNGRQADPDLPAEPTKRVTAFTGSEAHHLRGIDIAHVLGACGVSPNTKPGRSWCSCRGCRSGPQGWARDGPAVSISCAPSDFAKRTTCVMPAA